MENTSNRMRPTTLFVCRANVGRSQAASALYNKRFGEQSKSAGTMVGTPGEQVKNRKGADVIIDILREDDIDISHNRRVQLTEEMASNFDRIVVLAEPEAIPQWLRRHPKAIFWNIQDTKQQDNATTRRIIGEIKAKIEEL